MLNKNKSLKTADDLLWLLDTASLNTTHRRDMKSAVKRVCDVAGCTPKSLHLDVANLRRTLRQANPAAHDITPKTWANLLSRFRAALRLAGVIDPAWQGSAMRHAAWAPLIQAIAGDKRLSCGLAPFFNWCASQAITPEGVNDEVVQGFHRQLEDRTLCPKPRDVVRRVPHLCNEVSEKIEFWPKTRLTTLSFKTPPKRLQWCDLSENFQRDAEAYLAMRGKPDLFDERPNAPKGPLAASTLHQQSEHLRLAASVLIKSGVPAEDIKTLADLVQSERFKTVLRYYHEQANRQPNAFVVCLAQTLIQVAQYYTNATADEVAQLKRFASKLPPVPADLTPKNKAVALQFESDRLRAKLLFFPEELMGEVAQHLARGRLRFVDAQVAALIEIDLVIPLRPQNLSSLTWQRNFSEPDGPNGRLLLHIPARETKSKLQDLVAEIPDDAAKRLRWYRRYILPGLNADPNGPLFVTKTGRAKTQRTLSKQFTQVIRRRLGVHLTAHQPRHLGTIWYLDEHPEDFETPRAFLGHAWSKTTRIYAGDSSRRASKAYNQFVLQQRDALKLKRKRKPSRKAKPTGTTTTNPRDGGDEPCGS
jgi:integrase